MNRAEQDRFQLLLDRLRKLFGLSADSTIDDLNRVLDQIEQDQAGLVSLSAANPERPEPAKIRRLLGVSKFNYDRFGRGHFSFA